MADNQVLVQFLSTEDIIFYSQGPRGFSVKLDEEDYAKLYERLGSKWHNDNDKLILFEYYQDGSFNIEKQKEVFDYRTREQTKKYYPYTEVEQSEVISAYNIFIDLFEEIRVKDLQKAKDQVKLELQQATTIFRQNLVTLRTDLLYRSDWTQLPDVTFKRQNEKEMWIQYRQYLRDMPESDDWSMNALKVEFPITPPEYFKLPDQSVEYLKDPNHFENRYVLYQKLKLIRFMENLGMPSLGFIPDSPAEVDYDSAKETLAKALKKIDETWDIPALTFVPFGNETTLDEMITNIDEYTQTNL